MLTEERFNAILSILEGKKAVTVQELASLLDISESTVRRDLNTLSNQGRLNKVHGGATVKKSNSGVISTEEDIKTKSTHHMEEKERIGKYASTLIRNDDFVFIDAGTTTEKLINYIPSTSKATFVTNGIVHAKKLIYKGLRAFVIGGELKLTTEAIVGVTAVENLGKYNFTKCFLGANGIDKIRGLTTPDIDEAILKNRAYENSYITYVLADSSKFNRVFAVSFGAMNRTCIITDKLSDEEYKNYTIVKEVGE